CSRESRPAVPPDPRGPLPPCGLLAKGPGNLRFRGVSMIALGTFGLSQSVGRIVLDRTGLTGDFDVDLNWTPAPGEPGDHLHLEVRDEAFPTELIRTVRRCSP